MAKKTVGSVCSGIEAASVAWRPLGYEFAWFSEIAPFPSRLLAEKYPDVPNLGDMTLVADLIRAGEIDAPDVVCGGTPCQAFSYAGWQRGLEDDRGNLTLRFVDIVDANDDVRHEQGKPPTVVLWENVEGVLSDKTNAFGCFVSSLAGLPRILQVEGRWPAAGFVRGPRRTVAWRVIDAKYFGIPQQRRRLYVVAGDDSVRPEMILFERHLADSDVDYAEGEDVLRFSKDGHEFELFRSYTDCLYASYATKWNGNAAANNGSLFVVQDGRIRRLSPVECERLMGFPDGYTDIPGATKSNRYQALGNSWAVPVIRWLGERFFSKRGRGQNSWFPIQSHNDFEYHDLSSGLVRVSPRSVLNCSERPDAPVLGALRDVVDARAQEDIYLSPVGCAGILRRREERRLSMNPRLEEVLSSWAGTMSPEEIEIKSKVQRRGRYAATDPERVR